MRRDLWMILLLGCLLVLFLEAPVALSSVTADLAGPYPVWGSGDGTSAVSASPSTKGEASWIRVPAPENSPVSERLGPDPETPTLGRLGPADEEVVAEPRFETAQRAERSS